MTSLKSDSLIYLDHHATTPLDPRVREAMLPYFSEKFGNPSSTEHFYGVQAEKAVQRARVQIAGLIHAQPEEILFTSCATESNNLALKGVAEVFGSDVRPHFITQVTEHKSVLNSCAYLETKGVEVTYLQVDGLGRINLEDLRKSIRKNTLMISIMMANNEIGALHPVAEIGRIAKEKKIYFHCDAAQAAGKLAIHVEDMGIDLLSFSAHKMYGPKGAAALFVRKKNPRVRIAPQLHGGGQESGLRSGTLNVPAIVGFGEACRIAQLEMAVDENRIRALRDYFFSVVKEAVPELVVHGDMEKRLYHNLNLSFPGVDGDSLLSSLAEKMAVSSGSACAAQSKEPSYVLKALGVPQSQINTSVRFGFGKFLTEEQVKTSASSVIQVYSHLKEISPFRGMR